MFRSFTLLLLVSLLACSAALPALAQSNDVHLTPGAVKLAHADVNTSPMADADLLIHGKPLKKDVNLVLVPVTITDPMNRAVPGLQKDNFLLTEDNRPQEIRALWNEDAPISVGVVLDVSGSMADKMDKARQAVVEFFRMANPQDEFFVVAFSERPEVLVNFTSSVDEIESRLEYEVPKGPTSLLDAIYVAMNGMRRAHYARRALLIISDGGDNHSRYTEDEIKEIVQEADVQIYALGLVNRHPTTPEEMHGPMLLNAMSGATGGQTYFIAAARELPEVAGKIGVELRNQYLLGYRPANPGQYGKWRKIKVKVKPPAGSPTLHVYAKTGYYAAAE